MSADGPRCEWYTYIQPAGEAPLRCRVTGMIGETVRLQLPSGAMQSVRKEDCSGLHSIQLYGSGA